jgi:hypothetical protein
MFREFCDLCKTELLEKPKIERDGELVKPIFAVRIKVTRRYSDATDKDDDWTLDDLCPDCAKKFRFEE